MNSTKSNGKMFNLSRRNSVANSMSPPRANRTPSNSRNEKVASLARSPFKETVIPSLVESNKPVNRTVRVEPINGRAPSVVEDLVSSQSKDKPVAMRGGKMLRAIREKTEALKAMLMQSKRHTRRHGRTAKYRS
jgi:hypothetical protein